MTPQEASTVAAFLLPQIELEVATTIRVLSAVPEDKKTYSPSEKCMTAAELVNHIVNADIWFLESIVKGEFGPYPEDSDRPVADSVAAYQSKASQLIQQIRQLEGEHLAKNVVFHSWDLPNVTYMQIMQKHSVHHRGQLSSYLRPMGAKVPCIYGSSADETFAAGA